MGVIFNFRLALTGTGRQSNEPKFWLKRFWKLHDLPRL